MIFLLFFSPRKSAIQILVFEFLGKLPFPVIGHGDLLTCIRPKSLKNSTLLSSNFDNESKEFENCVSLLGTVKSILGIFLFLRTKMWEGSTIDLECFDDIYK